MNNITVSELTVNDQHLIEPIVEAAHNRIRVIINYDSESSLSGRRTIVPFSLRISNAGDVSLLAWTVLEGTRAYRLDRIRDIEPSVDPFPDDLEFEVEL